MMSEIERLDRFIFGKISDVVADPASEEYSGCDFRLDGKNVKFRKAKLTPKKIGLFVTLWKRNSNGQTEPFNFHDDFDFYIIAAQQEQHFGYFIFPKHVLSDHGILTCGSKEGKRGFRVYPSWVIPESKQAEKTKRWQGDWFVGTADGDMKEKLCELFCR